MFYFSNWFLTSICELIKTKMYIIIAFDIKFNFTNVYYYLKVLKDNIKSKYKYNKNIAFHRVLVIEIKTLI